MYGLVAPPLPLPLCSGAGNASGSRDSAQSRRREGESSGGIGPRDCDRRARAMGRSAVSVFGEVVLPRSFQGNNKLGRYSVLRLFVRFKEPDNYWFGLVCLEGLYNLG